jgi:pyruvate kinase
VRSGDLPQPLDMKKGEPFTFTIQRGISEPDRVSVNYDGFVDDVSVGDEILVDGEWFFLQCCLVCLNLAFELPC